MTTKTKQPDPDEAREQVHFAALLIGPSLRGGGLGPSGGRVGRLPAPDGRGAGCAVWAVDRCPDRRGGVAASYVQALGKGYEPSMEPATEADREALIILRHEVAEAHRLAGGGAIH